MLDKIDRKLLSLLQTDCTLSLQALADAVNLTTTPCWKRLKRLEDEGILLGRVALLEFKGAHLLNDPYEIEKRQVGERWAAASGGRAVFGWLTQNRDGVGTEAQLNQTLA